MTGSVSARSTLDLIQLLDQGQYHPTPEAEALVEDGLEIGALSPDLQRIVRENPTDFQQGDLDRIDTDDEARRLLQAAIGTDNPGLQGHPGAEALQNLDSAELLQLLIDWIKNGGNEQAEGQPAAAPMGRDMGSLGGGPQFSGAPQSTSWSPPASGSTSAPGLSAGGSPPSGLGGRLVQAIAQQESGGDPTVVNRDAAGADGLGIGAMGKYQILGENMVNWSQEAAQAGAIPQHVADQIRANPHVVLSHEMEGVQDQIAAFKMEQYYQEALSKGYSEDDAVRYVASAWYSGSGNNLNSQRPQGGYPSIQAYTYQVLDRFNSIA